MNKIKKEVSEQEALFKLSALCSQAEHSSGEMKEKMRRWQLPADAQERVMQRLLDEKYVDDDRYSRLFVRDKLRFCGWGPRKISEALRLKGVSAVVAQEHIDAVAEEDWLETLRPLIAAKRRTVKALSPYELQAKLMRFAVGRGFSVDMARRCIGDFVDMDNDFASDDF